MIIQASRKLWLNKVKSSQIPFSVKSFRKSNTFSWANYQKNNCLEILSNPHFSLESLENLSDPKFPLKFIPNLNMSWNNSQIETFPETFSQTLTRISLCLRKTDEKEHLWKLINPNFNVDPSILRRQSQKPKQAMYSTNKIYPG